MTTMITELYEALKEAGASEEKAKAAAEALAGFTRQEERLDHVGERLGRLEERFDRLEADVASIKVDVAAIKAELGLLKWMVGTVGFGVALALVRLFLFWPGAT